MKIDIFQKSVCEKIPVYYLVLLSALHTVSKPMNLIRQFDFDIGFIKNTVMSNEFLKSYLHILQDIFVFRAGAL